MTAAKYTGRRRRAPRMSRGHWRVFGPYCCLLSSILALLTVSGWSYWPVAGDLFHLWNKSDDYSAGQLVPLVAVFLVWRERKELQQCSLSPCWLGGIVGIIAAQLFRTYGFLFMRSAAERYSLIVAAAGLVLLVAGMQVFRRVAWILLFLVAVHGMQ